MNVQKTEGSQKCDQENNSYRNQSRGRGNSQNNCVNHKFNSFTKFRDYQNQNRKRRYPSNNNNNNKNNYKQRRSNERHFNPTMRRNSSHVSKYLDNSNDEFDFSKKKNQSLSSTQSFENNFNTSNTANAIATTTNTENEDLFSLHVKNSHMNGKSTISTINKKFSSSSSLSDSSSTDSDNSLIRNIKNSIKQNLEKKTDPLTSEIQVKNKAILTNNETTPQELSKNDAVKKNIGRKSVSNSESESSSDNESYENENEKTEQKIDIKPKLPSEEDVICLGNVVNFENLADDDENCLLCDKKGHTSFYCQTICRNCGKKYHNFKNCPQPANISIVLQQFMEFCMKQCCEYNPNKHFETISSPIKPFQNVNKEEKQQFSNKSKRYNSKFQKNDNSISDSDSSSGIETNSKKQKHEGKISKKKSNKIKSDLCPSTQSLQFMPSFTTGNSIPFNYNSNDSDSDLETTSKKSEKRRRIIKKHNQNTEIDPNSFFASPQMAAAAAFMPTFNQAAASAMPFVFNPPTNLSFNPMLAFKQMMGLNPTINYTSNLGKEK